MRKVEVWVIWAWAISMVIMLGCCMLESYMVCGSHQLSEPVRKGHP